MLQTKRKGKSTNLWKMWKMAEKLLKIAKWVIG